METITSRERSLGTAAMPPYNGSSINIFIDVKRLIKMKWKVFSFLLSSLNFIELIKKKLLKIIFYS